MTMMTLADQAKDDAFYAADNYTAGYQDEGTSEDGYASTTDSALLRATLRLYGSVFLGSMLVYAVMRKLYPKLFKVRSWVPEMNCELAKKSFGWLDWGVFSVNDDDMMEHCGLDSICFLRALRLGRKLALAGSVNALWLIPLYYTAKTDESTQFLIDPLVLISIAHLPSSSKRFLGTVLAAYILFLYAMWLIFLEYKWFAKYRHLSLARTTPSAYAVYVSGVPRQYRSSKCLAQYFRSCSTNEAVLEAHVAISLDDLEAKIARRDVIVEKLEHALALECQRGKVETHQELSIRNGRLQKVESVVAFKNQVADLNTEIEARIHRLLTMRKGETIRQLAPHDHDNFATFDSFNRDEAREEDLRRERTFSFDNLWNRDRLFSRDRRVAVDASGDELDDELQKFLSPLRSDEFSLDASHLSFVEENEVLATASVATVSQQQATVSQRTFSAGALAPQSTDNEPGSAGCNGESERFQCQLTVSQPTSILEELNGGLPEDEIASTLFAETEAQSMSSEHVSHFTSSGKVLVHRRMSVGNGVRLAGGTLAMAGKSLTKGSIIASKAASEAVLKTVNAKTVSKSIKVAQSLGENVVISAGAVVPLLANVTKSEGDSRDAGFVVFTKLHAVQAALQMVHHPKAYTMDVQEAPDPNDIFWRNVGMPYSARRVGWMLSALACSVLCIFWSFPTAFISSMTEVNSLKGTLPRLGALIEELPQLEIILALLAPLLLLSLNEVFLPMLLKWFATWEGHISAAKLEASLFLKLGVFMIIQTFFVSLFTGSFTSEIANILQDPASLITYLSISLPSQSSYFIQYLMTTTLLLQPFETLRLYPLCGAFLRHFMGPRLTEKERKRPWGWLYPLDNPPDFWYAETFAQIILYFMVYFVYATIAPVTSIFIYPCFYLMEWGYRFQYIHNYPRAFDTGGRMWRFFMHFVLCSLLIAILTLIGVLLLKESVYAAPALGPLLAINIMFIIFINGKHSSVSEFLPSRDCVLHDSRFMDEGKSYDFVQDAYLQPALRAQCIQLDMDDSERGSGSLDNLPQI